MKTNEKGQYVSDNGQWVWDGGAWVPAEQAQAEAILTEYVQQVETESKARPARCAEQDCLEPPRDYVRLALTTASGSMAVEMLLCEFHIATLEMGNKGSFLYIRPRERLDLNGR